MSQEPQAIFVTAELLNHIHKTRRVKGAGVSIPDLRFSCEVLMDPRDTGDIKELAAQGKLTYRLRSEGIDITDPRQVGELNVIHMIGKLVIDELRGVADEGVIEILAADKPASILKDNERAFIALRNIDPRVYLFNALDPNEIPKVRKSVTDYPYEYSGVSLLLEALAKQPVAGSRGERSHR